MRTVVAAVIAAGSQGRVHAYAYAQLPGTTLAGIADPDVALATATAERYGATVYADYRELLAAERPELLSICTPPALHREVFDAAVEAGVRGIHMEKPIALTWGDARHIVETAAARGIRLSINHQRRLEELHVQVKAAVDAGEIGEIVSVEGYCANLFDWGSHVVDLLFFYLGDVPAHSVLAQLDVAAVKRVYGALTETAAVVHVRYANGVNGIILTGRDQEPLSPLGPNGLVLHGRSGRVEIFGDRAVIRADGREPRTVDPGVDEAYRVDLGGANPLIIRGTVLALAELAGALEQDAPLTLDAVHGLAAAQVIFAAYESSARRGRVTLPLDTTDNALARGLEAGYWTPTERIESTF